MEPFIKFGALVFYIIASVGVGTFLVLCWRWATRNEWVKNPEFQHGYDLAMKDLEEFGSRGVRESLDVRRGNNPFNAEDYGYACALAEIMDESWPKPWGKLPKGDAP